MSKQKNKIDISQPRVMHLLMTHRIECEDPQKDGWGDNQFESFNDACMYGAVGHVMGRSSITKRSKLYLHIANFRLYIIRPAKLENPLVGDRASLISAS